MVGIILCGEVLDEELADFFGPMSFYKTHYVICTKPT